jgi:DNA polymerase-3 subunit delta
MDDPVPLLLSMMAKQYQNIWIVKEMTSRYQGTAEVAQAIGMSPWNVKKLMDQGRFFSDASLRGGIVRCHQTDVSIKRGFGPKELLMEKLVIDLCRPAKTSSPMNKRG